MCQDVKAIYATESRRVLATLIRLLGDFELAEEALHEAFLAALEQWPEQGIPDNPRAWLVSAGRFKGIDQIRRRARFDLALQGVAELLELEADEDPACMAEDDIVDDQLRLIFTCCHPSLTKAAQTAMSLREICGLTTEEIAHAFLSKPSTVAQRIVRAKTKIREANIPYEVPEPEQRPERLHNVLQVIYLVFNEGYSASQGASLIRIDLCREAIRLSRMLCSLLPDPETTGLLALLLLQDSRRSARITAEGDLVTLEDQDRRLWDQGQIAEGCQLVQAVLRGREFGTYTLQAAIAAVHSEAASTEQTDWRQIVGLYDMLLIAEPSPIIELNRAVALAMHRGPDAGLTVLDAIAARGELVEYYLFHAARADLFRRSERWNEARSAYILALKYSQQGPEQRYLRRRLAELP
ncbi:RNA polymerase sigma factor containing a TPR repeat domain [Oleiphilus messinensis]|uniref:RNA polymerase sigma factor containing a TPR repeat domain n=1 Tax=Oleiphilus messinensis TaxID=141451 RepID=A0A1Y0IHH6_9GAMM|nr:RNA polymerase sigma factor [Oleiphilus messinensis]ARU59005.1 RNA polymerase sigma factor containing a TPR repeat domain [Oleiphilus messinensis]